jgi:hypothetical protein
MAVLDNRATYEITNHASNICFISICNQLVLLMPYVG